MNIETADKLKEEGDIIMSRYIYLGYRYADASKKYQMAKNIYKFNMNYQRTMVCLLAELECKILQDNNFIEKNDLYLEIARNYLNIDKTKSFSWFERVILCHVLKGSMLKAADICVELAEVHISLENKDYVIEWLEKARGLYMGENMPNLVLKCSNKIDELKLD